MSHPFGDLISQHLGRKRGLSQSRLAQGIIQDPAVIAKMCKGERLTGSQARERVLSIIRWFRNQGVLAYVEEANALLEAAGLAGLKSDQPVEEELLHLLKRPASAERHAKSPSGHESPVAATASAPSADTPRAAKASSTHLPAQRIRLIGREREMDEIRLLLLRDDVGLVTLTGPGGTGKTRLGLQVAADLLDVFADGVYLVELAVISDPALVPSAIAQALGLREMADQPIGDSLSAYLQDRHLLLILDNFEQVLLAAVQVAELMRAAPRLKVLVTSREALHVYAEHEFPVPPLALPDVSRQRPTDQDLVSAVAQNEAVQLLVERAKAALPSFKLTGANAPAVAEICVRLDGLPLAIELAAARTKMLVPETMLTRLSSRLSFLTGGPRDLAARQQTLRNTIDWSYGLLAPGEQVLFTRLAVFVGGFTLEAAEAICNAEGDLPMDLLDGVQSLRDKSLLQRIEGPGGELRFRMLETIREYALERMRLETSRITEGELLRRLHAEYYAVLAEQAEPELFGEQQVLCLGRLDADHDNLRAALEWCRTGTNGTELGLRLAGALWPFWEMRGYFTEGRRWLDAHLEGSTTFPDLVRAKALDGAGVLARHQGDYARATGLHEESLALRQELQDKAGVASTIANQGQVAHDQGNYERAKEYYNRALELLPGVERSSSEAAQTLVRIYNGLGKAQREQGRFEEARECYKRALSLSHRQGNRKDEAQVLNNLGVLANSQRQFVEALTYHRQALEIRRAIGDRPGEGISLYNLAVAAQETGDYGQAKEYLAAALAIHRATGNRREEINTWLGLGILHHQLGNFDEARSCLEQGLNLSRKIGDRSGEAYILANMGPVTYDRDNLQGAEQLLAEQMLADGLAIARELDDKPTMSYFLSYLGLINLKAQRVDQAIEHANAALTLRREIGLHSWTTADLATLAAAHLELGGTAKALSYAHEALAILDDPGGEEPEVPQRDYFLCYRVFAAAGQTELAHAALRSAHKVVKARAERIGDTALRQTFLDQVPINREIRQAAETVLTSRMA